tara:strand:- start:2172 stop:2303 length:132 start_codon:yes stop_codon:yes gene_type:complete
MEKYLINKINSIILELNELKKMLHPLQPNTNISFVGDSSDEDE